MTTIASDGNTIACDGRLTSGSSLDSNNVNKVFKIGGKYYGYSGNWDCAEAIVEYLSNGGEKPSLPDTGHYNLLVLNHKRELFIVDGPNLTLRKVRKPMAIGSGCDYAIGAMLMGATPERAVRIASKYDIKTGGKVRSYSVADL